MKYQYTVITTVGLTIRLVRGGGSKRNTFQSELLSHGSVYICSLKIIL